MATNEEYIRKNKIITVDHYRNTRLHYACALNRLDVVKEELSTGKRIDPENYLGWTPLMMAVRNGHYSIVQLLIFHRADASKSNKFGVSVFHLSVTSGVLPMVKDILEHLLTGGISRQIIESALSPISLAVMFNQPQVQKYLIERSFDLNAATPASLLTPLMFAAAIGDTRTIKRLVNLRADTALRNRLGESAPDISAAKHAKAEARPEAAPAVPPPVILVSQPQQAYQLAPFVIGHEQRGSPNCGTPVFTPSPFTPMPNAYQQVFFPSDFAQQVSPLVYSNEMLNAPIMQSPFFAQTPNLCYAGNYS